MVIASDPNRLYISYHPWERYTPLELKIFPGHEARLLLTLGLFFGWLLSFPLYGPVLAAMASEPVSDVGSLAFWFVCAHAAGLLAGALLIRRQAPWRFMMLTGLALTIGLHLLLALLPMEAWPYLMPVLGPSAGLFILGWSHPYTGLLAPNRRLRLMAATIIVANLALLVSSILAHTLAPSVTFTFSLLLLLPIWPLVLGMEAAKTRSQTESGTQSVQSRSFYLLLGVVCLFFFGFYLNGGLLYNVVYTTFVELGQFSLFFRFIPYMIVLGGIWGLGDRVSRPALIYLSSSLLGLAFVTFAFLTATGAAYFVAEVLFQAAFAILDLFSWVILGDIAAFSHSRLVPHQIFGYGLAAMVSAIFMGQVVGERLLHAREEQGLLTALFAVIFITYLIIPWLKQRLEGWYSVAELVPPNQTVVGPPEQLVDQLASMEPLTAREKQIAALLLQGYSNREVAALLHISLNTLKTHVKNLYRKVGVVQKRELISMAARLKND